MIDIIIGFLIGLFIGSLIGMLLTSLCIASGNNKKGELNSLDDYQDLKKENNINNKEDI